ncbi:DMT family transporter [bacterium]|nr:DMT family transporter [bacterium]
MNFVYKIPGPLLILTGGFCLSWGGLILRTFESASIWQILFYRSIFFLWVLIAFILLTYRKKTFKKIKEAGVPGLIGGVFLSTNFVAYMYSMMETTVANVVFIISTQTVFLPIVAYIFLKEKISPRGYVAIMLAMIGVTLMIGDSLGTGSLKGNLAALTIPINFSVLVLIIRKYPKVDMIPAVFYAGILSCLYGLFLLENFVISTKDIWLAFLLGVPQLAFGFIFITIGSRTTPAVMVGLLMLMESIFAPIWVWLFYNEIPPISVLIGGIIILSAVVMKSLDYKKV